MRACAFTAMALVAAILGGRPLQGGEDVEFTSPKAKEARKAFEKTAEKLKAEYEAKLRKAREDYAKSLEAALKEAKRARNAVEAERIEKVLAELKKEASGEKGPKKPVTKAPEKGPGGITYEGGSGESLAEAVIIKGATDSEEGVDAEYAWLKVHFPRHKPGGQSLRSDGGKKYDVIRISGPDGEKEIFFDITDFFGKM